MAATIAARYDAAAFFFSTAGRTRADQCLNHLCVEVIERHGLAHDRLPDHAGDNSSHLSRLLNEAAAAGGTVWLVIDALDEAQAAPGAMAGLPLPDHLPDGVFAIVTHRPGTYAPVVSPAFETAIETLLLTGDGQDQQTDVARFLRERVTNDEAVRAQWPARDHPSMRTNSSSAS